MSSRFRRFIRNTRAFLSGIALGIKNVPIALKDFRGWSQLQQEQMKGYRAELEALGETVTETDKRMLFYCVGQAITAWAKMEEMLVGIAALLLRTPIEKAGVVMYSTINFNVWLSVITDLFEQDEKLKPLKPRWNKISERIRAVKDKRDQIAHHSAEETGTPSAAVLAATAVSIRRSKFDMRTKSQRLRPLDIDEIQALAETVAAIAVDLYAFLTVMFQTLGVSPEKSSSPTTDHSPEEDSQ